MSRVYLYVNQHELVNVSVRLALFQALKLDTMLQFAVAYYVREVFEVVEV